MTGLWPEGGSQPGLAHRAADVVDGQAEHLRPARGQPQAASQLDADPDAQVDALPADHSDQTPTFDPTDPEPAPELDLDRTRGA
jgi:hypothetical protein